MVMITSNVNGRLSNALAPFPSPRLSTIPFYPIDRPALIPPLTKDRVTSRVCSDLDRVESGIKTGVTLEKRKRRKKVGRGRCSRVILQFF